MDIEDTMEMFRHQLEMQYLNATACLGIGRLLYIQEEINNLIPEIRRDNMRLVGIITG